MHVFVLNCISLLAISIKYIITLVIFEDCNVMCKFLLNLENSVTRKRVPS